MKMPGLKSKTFYRVTNKEIYEEIKAINVKLNALAIKTTVTAAVVAVIVSIVVGLLA